MKKKRKTAHLKNNIKDAIKRLRKLHKLLCQYNKSLNHLNQKNTYTNEKNIFNSFFVLYLICNYYKLQCY